MHSEILRTRAGCPRYACADTRGQAFRPSGLPDFRTSGILDFWNSGLLEFWNSGLPDFRSSGLPDFWTSAALPPLLLPSESMPAPSSNFENLQKPLENFRARTKRLAIHPLELAVLWVVGAHIVFLPWALGTMR